PGPADPNHLTARDKLNAAIAHESPFSAPQPICSGVTFLKQEVGLDCLGCGSFEITATHRGLKDGKLGIELVEPNSSGMRYYALTPSGKLCVDLSISTFVLTVDPSSGCFTGRQVQHCWFPRNSTSQLSHG